MDNQTRVIEYKCPCCSAGLKFGDESQKLTCEYCGNEFDVETVKAFNAAENEESKDDFTWDPETKEMWSEEEQAYMNLFQCPSCGGEVIADENTAATFCPYCGNPTVMPARLSGGIKPDAIIPFKQGKEDARAAFLNFCKGKPLLPRMFTSQQQIQKITGLYVPFWLYDCDGDFKGSYNATKIHTWSDSNYNYTRTEHFLLNRSARGNFVGIPMDGSSKMDDIFMESIEPYQYCDITAFDMAYLTGYFADKYDVEMGAGKERIRNRVQEALDQKVAGTYAQYATVTPTSKQLNVSHSKARYVLLPVWMLNSKYEGRLFTFAMNGQTGKISGTLPVSRSRAISIFTGIMLGSAALITVVRFLFGF